MKKVIFLDRDGTLNIDKGYTHLIKDYKLFDGVIEALDTLSKRGYTFVIMTNQSGIGRGYFTEDDFFKFINHMIVDFKKNNIDIEAFYFSPYHEKNGIGKYKKKDASRKPDCGMYDAYVKEYGDFSFENSWSIGDSLRDLQATKKFNKEIKSILISLKKIDDADIDYSVQSFLEVLNIIK